MFSWGRLIDPQQRSKPSMKPSLPFIVAVLTRMIAVFFKHPGFPNGWGGEMIAVANSIARGKGFSSPYLIDTGATSLVPPVYPYLLAPVLNIFGYSTTSGIISVVINVLLSSLVVIPLFIFAKKLFNSTSAWIAVWLWVLYPLTGHSDVLQNWSTSLYTLLLTSFLAFTVSLSGKVTPSPRIWALFGGLMGLLILTEPVSGTLVGVSILWLLLKERVPVKNLAFALLLASILPGVWLIRNYLVFDQFVFLRSGFGLELSKGVRDYELAGQFSTSLPNRNPEELKRYTQMGELSYVQQRRAEALQWIQENPGTYTQRLIRRVIAFWTGRYLVSRDYLFYGQFESLKVVMHSLPVVGSFICLIYMMLIRHRAFWLCYGIIALYPLVYYITQVELRQRIPIEPFLLCLSVGVVFRRSIDYDQLFKEHRFGSWLAIRRKRGDQVAEF